LEGNWSNGPLPATGVVLLWQEGQPVEEDIFVPLHELQRAAGVDPYADIPGQEEVMAMLAKQGYEYLGPLMEESDPDYVLMPEGGGVVVSKVQLPSGIQ